MWLCIKKVLHLPQPVLGTPFHTLVSSTLLPRLTSTDAASPKGHGVGGARAFFPRSFSTAQSPSVRPRRRRSELPRFPPRVLTALLFIRERERASERAQRRGERSTPRRARTRRAGGHRRLLVLVGSSRLVSRHRLPQPTGGIPVLDATRLAGGPPQRSWDARPAAAAAAAAASGRVLRGRRTEEETRIASSFFFFFFPATTTTTSSGGRRGIGLAGFGTQRSVAASPLL